MKSSHVASVAILPDKPASYSFSYPEVKEAKSLGKKDPIVLDSILCSIMWKVKSVGWCNFKSQRRA